jgi:hypothetical protein
MHPIAVSIERMSHHFLPNKSFPIILANIAIAITNDITVRRGTASCS